MNKVVENKINVLVEEGIVDTFKNNKLAAGLGMGALGAGAYALNQYAGSGDHYMDSSIDNAQAISKANEDIAGKNSRYDDSQNYWKKDILSNEGKLRDAENGAFKARPSDKMERLMTKYGQAAENVTAAENPKSIEQIRTEYNDNFEGSREERDNLWKQMEALNRNGEEYMTPAERAKYNILSNKFGELGLKELNRGTEIDNMEAYRKTPEYVDELQKNQELANTQLRHAQSKFDNANNRFADKWLDSSDRVNRYQDKIEMDQNRIDSNKESMDKYATQRNHELNTELARNDSRADYGKKAQASDILNSQMAGAGAGALGIGATAAALANRKRK